MIQKTIYSITFLILVASFAQKQPQLHHGDNRIAGCQTYTYLKSEFENHPSEFKEMGADTITNWQLYKDAELLFASNLFDSNRYTVEIKRSDKFENLILTFFNDFNNEIIKREITLVADNTTVATFENENRSHSPFPIDKFILDGIRKRIPNKEIKIIYSDPIQKNGIIVGLLKLTNE